MERELQVALEERRHEEAIKVKAKTTSRYVRSAVDGPRPASCSS